MENWKQAPWSRIRGQNSVNKEVLEIVGNGKLTGSFQKETIAVSDTIWISVQKSTQPNPSPGSSTQQCVKNASRTRSPRGRSPSGKLARLPCKDYLKGTCTTPFCKKVASSRMLVLQVRKWMQILVNSALMHTARNSPAKGPKRMGDKSAVAILKNTRTIGLRISRYGAAEVYNDFAEELKHTEANPMCSIHWSRVTSC